LIYYAENRDKILNRNRQWRQNNLERSNAYRKKHYQENREKTLEKTREYQAEHREYYRSRNRFLFQDARVKAMKHLNPELKCEKCGIDNFRVLTIDHKNNDGCLERQEKTSYRIYREIEEMPRDEARKSYQALCRNCNWLRRYEQE